MGPRAEGPSIAVGILVAMALAGCSTRADVGADGSMPMDGAADVTPYADADTDAALSCPPPMRPLPDADNCTMGGASLSYVINVFDLARSDPTTGTPGFNLDGECTRSGDATGCGKADTFYDVDQDGVLSSFEMGVDDQFAGLADTFDTFVGFPSQVDTGYLLLLIRVDDVDDPATPTSDPCVELSLTYGVAPDPLLLDAAGHIAPDQTFGTAPPSVHSLARIEGGRLIASLPALELPFEVSGMPYLFPLDGTRIAFDVHPDMVSDGVLAGGMDIDALTSQLGPVLSLIPIDDPPSLLDPLADLAPDASGVCHSISTAFAFGAVPAIIMF